MDANATGKTKRDWFGFKRVDYVATKIILGMAVFMSVLFCFVRPVVEAATKAPLLMHYNTKITNGIELPRGAIQKGDATATINLLFKDATAGERLGQAMPGLLIGTMTIAIAWLLFQLLRATQAREPFSRRNVRRINAIALIVGAGGMLVAFAQGLSDNVLQTTGRLPYPNYLIFGMTLNPLPILVMLVILLFGQAFRRGVELRDDVEGLV